MKVDDQRRPLCAELYPRGGSAKHKTYLGSFCRSCRPLSRAARTRHSFVAAARLQWCAVKSLSRAPLKLENVMKLPFIRTGDSHPRSIAKTVSWRVTGSVDTFVLGLIFTGNAKIAGSIAVAEMATKMVLYYLHERAWSAIRWNQ